MEQKSSQPHWWWIPLAIIAIVVPAGTIWNNNCVEAEKVAREERQRQEDLARAQAEKAEEEKRNQPNLKFVSGDGPRQDGSTHLKFHNQSLTRNAVLCSIEFSVTDARQLETIARVHPRVPPMIQTATVKDEIRLVHGTWNQPLTAYTFYVYPDTYVLPDKPIDLATCIVDAGLVNHQFRGTLRIDVTNGHADELADVTLRVRRQ